MGYGRCTVCVWKGKRTNSVYQLKRLDGGIKIKYPEMNFLSKQVDVVYPSYLKFLRNFSNLFCVKYFLLRPFILIGRDDETSDRRRTCTSMGLHITTGE